MNSALMHLRLRRSFLRASLQNTARSHFEFTYPHSNSGVNTAFNNVPQTNEYPNIQRTFQPGEQAPLAHQNKRVFPDWYKPYSTNYNGEGYFVGILGGLLLCIIKSSLLTLVGWSYTNDIKEQKGRKSRKIFDRGDHTISKVYKEGRWAEERIQKGDPEFTKYLHKKERAHVHH